MGTINSPGQVDLPAGQGAGTWNSNAGNGVASNGPTNSFVGPLVQGGSANTGTALDGMPVGFNGNTTGGGSGSAQSTLASNQAPNSNVSNSGTTNFAPTTAQTLSNPGQFKGGPFDPSSWVNPGTNALGYQNSMMYGSGNNSSQGLNVPNFAPQSDYSGVFSGGNQQYVYNMSPEDKNAVYAGTADIPSLLQKYGLQYDKNTKRLWKPADWLATNTNGVEVNKQTGGTYNTPGMGQIDNQVTFGTAKDNPNSAYHLPAGTFNASNTTGALTPATTTSTSTGTGTGTGTGSSTSTGTGTGTGSSAATNTLTHPQNIQQAILGMYGLNPGQTQTSTPNPLILRAFGIDPNVSQYEGRNGTPTDLETAQSSYGQPMGSPFQANSILAGLMTGIDPRLVNGQVTQATTSGGSGPLSTTYATGSNTPRLMYNPSTGGYYLGNPGQTNSLGEQGAVPYGDTLGAH